MLYFSKLKIISIVIFCSLLIFFSFSNFANNEDFFFKKKVNLGLDLQGGSYLLLEVDKGPVINQTLQTKLSQVRNYFKKKKLKLSIISWARKKSFLNPIKKIRRKS